MNKIQALQLLGLEGTVTKADIKLAYKRKAKQYHPDRNPAGTEIMQMINVAYDLIKDLEAVTVDLNAAMNDYPEAIAKAINSITHTGLQIEVCGLWVWVSGDTKSHKEALKKSGYFWSPKKKMWYFRPDDAKSYRRFSSSKDEWGIEKIRAKYGSQTYQGKNQIQYRS